MAIDEIVEKGAALKALDLERCSQEEVTARLSDFLGVSSYQVLGLPLESRNTWHRGVFLKTGEPFKNNLEQLIYPKIPSGKYGRLNYPDQRVFYASLNRATVLAELSPDAGHKIQYIICRPRTDAKVFVTLIGGYEQFHQSGRLLYPSSSFLDSYLSRFFACTNEDLLKKTLYVDSFLAALFRELDASSYRLTSAIAQQVFEAKNEPSGLIYPSVKTVASVNLAVLDRVFDDCFEVLSTEVCEIKRSYGHGVYDWECQPPTHVFGWDGTISWEKLIAVRVPSFSPRTGFNFPDGAPSWRVPKKA